MGFNAMIGVIPTNKAILRFDQKSRRFRLTEWIGLVGVRSIEGSYTNVMGLPTRSLYRALKDFIQ